MGQEWYEGCYSTGNVKGIVRRPRTIKIRALNREAKEITETHSGYVARIFQHEIDHLNGVRFPERICDRDYVHIVQPNEMVKYRDNEGWRTWGNTVKLNIWKEHM